MASPRRARENTRRPVVATSALRRARGGSESTPPPHDVATERRILALVGGNADTVTPLADPRLRGGLRSRQAQPFARGAFAVTRGERDAAAPAATGASASTPTPYQTRRGDAQPRSPSPPRPTTSSAAFDATLARGNNSASFARRLMRLRPDSRASDLGFAGNEYLVSSACGDGDDVSTTGGGGVLPVVGSTIPLAAYFASMAGESSDGAALLATQRGVSPPLASIDYYGQRGDGLQRRPPSPASCPVVDRAVLFSRERLQLQDRAALRSRAKTPADIERWHDRLPPSRVQQRIRERKEEPPAEQLQARLEARAQRLMSSHLTTSGVRFHEPRAAVGTLASSIAGIHTQAEAAVEAERKRRAEAALPTGGRRARLAVNSVVRTVAAARLAAGLATSKAAEVAAEQQQRKTATQLARERIQRLKEAQDTGAMERKAAAEAEAERAAAEEAEALRKRRFSDEEAVAILNEFYRIDELSTGGANIRDVRRWCDEVFSRPYDGAVAERILERESGKVTLARYCALVRPDITPEDAAVSLHLALSRKQPATGGGSGGGEGDPTTNRTAGKRTLKNASSPHRPRLPVRRGPASWTVAEGPTTSSSPSPPREEQEEEQQQQQQQQQQLAVVDRRRWMELTDPGIVRTLRLMYLAELEACGEVRGIPRDRYLRRFQRIMAKDELAEAFDAADVDGDGWLCFEEFARALWKGVCPGSAFPVPAHATGTL